MTLPNACHRPSQGVMGTDGFWSNRFHFCALAAGFIAASEGRLDDSLYVRELAYSLYEGGAFRDRVQHAASETAPIA